MANIGNADAYYENIHRELSSSSFYSLLEAWKYKKGPSKLDALISSKQFPGLELCFQYSSLVCLLKFNWFEQKNYILFIKTEL